MSNERDRRDERGRRHAARPGREADRGRSGRPDREADRARSRDQSRISTLPAVRALFATAPERADRLYFSDEMKGPAGPFAAALARRHKLYKQVGAEELAKIAGTAMHGGIVVVAEPQPVSPLRLEDVARWAAAGEPLLILDGLSNPHNLGAVARTAAFLGLARLVLTDHPAQALPSDAAHRVAKGGLEHLALHRAHRFAALLRQIKTHYRVVGAALSTRGKPPAAFAQSTRPIALILGNEEEGLAPETLSACPEIVTIPGAGAVQSLNVAASAAILIHALLAVPPARKPPDATAGPR